MVRKVTLILGAFIIVLTFCWTLFLSSQTEAEDISLLQPQKKKASASFSASPSRYAQCWLHSTANTCYTYCQRIGLYLLICVFSILSLPQSFVSKVDIGDGAVHSPQGSRMCEPKKKIAFMKTHKTASRYVHFAIFLLSRRIAVTSRMIQSI